MIPNIFKERKEKKIKMIFLRKEKKIRFYHRVDKRVIEVGGKYEKIVMICTL